MSQRPTGTVTFLFTDIEGSTQLWDRHPEWMASAHARQEGLLRAAFAAHGGYPYKMIGDAFQVAFASAPEALAAAADAQRALAAEPWGERGPVRVRMALHTGETEERADDYVGPLLNRVARLMSAGHGGQVLVSHATAELVRERLPPGVALRDLGERRLRDLSRPERVHQLVIAGLASDFPPLETLDSVPNNLPLTLTHFIGRERPLAEIAELLAAHRLVTLTGPGGAGKTRLSLQLAGEMLDRFADGVWFVELAPHGDEQELPRAVATALGITEIPGKPVMDVLAARLGTEERLVVLDNCEHVIGAAARIAAALLRASPRTRIITTSREPLRLAGEISYAVPPLSVPEPGSSASVASAAGSEAVQLFADRAASVSHSFALTDPNVPVVVEICRRLDGIPLAIELAAACVRTLSLHRIAERLDDRFRLLTRGERVALPRQQTLRALIDWSHDLLTEPERRVFRRLAVFAGGFSLAAAEAVCADDGVDEAEVVDLVANLVEKSLVVIDPGGERYRFLETIREYAAERLAAEPEVDVVRERHVRLHLEWAKRLIAGVGTRQDGDWRRLDAEHDNFLAALAFCGRSRDHAQDGLTLVLALRDYWWSRGALELGLRHSVEALAAPGAEQPTHLRARVLGQLPWMSVPLGRYAEAQAQAQAGLELARAIGAEDCATNAMRLLGIATYMCGDVDGALRHCEEALTIAERLPDPRPRQAAIMAIAEIHRHAGRLDRAEPLYEESLAMARVSGDSINVSLNLVNLAMVRVSRGKLDEARHLLAEVLAVVADAGVRTCGQVALDVCSAFAAARGEWEVAARVFGASETHRSRIGSQREPVDDAFLAPHIERARDALGAEAFAAVEAGGRAVAYEDALGEARMWLASLSPPP